MLPSTRIHIPEGCKLYFLNSDHPFKTHYVWIHLETVTAQFPFLETWWVKKWREATENGGSSYEASTCLMALDVSEK
jgi:hypothetical protein